MFSYVITQLLPCNIYKSYFERISQFFCCFFARTAIAWNCFPGRKCCRTWTEHFLEHSQVDNTVFLCTFRFNCFSGFPETSVLRRFPRVRTRAEKCPLFAAPLHLPPCCSESCGSSYLTKFKSLTCKHSKHSIALPRL